MDLIVNTRKATVFIHLKELALRGAVQLELHRDDSQSGGPGRNYDDKGLGAAFVPPSLYSQRVTAAGVRPGWLCAPTYAAVSLR